MPFYISSTRQEAKLSSSNAAVNIWICQPIKMRACCIPVCFVLLSVAVYKSFVLQRKVSTVNTGNPFLVLRSFCHKRMTSRFSKEKIDDITAFYFSKVLIKLFRNVKLTLQTVAILVDVKRDRFFFENFKLHATKSNTLFSLILQKAFIIIYKKGKKSFRFF